MRMAAAAGILVALGSVLLGQAPPANRAVTPIDPPLALVSGRVLDAQTGAPVPNARVSKSIPAVGSPVVLADAEGKFSFQLPQGSHLLAASKTGFMRQETAAIAGGNAVEIRLLRGAAVSGRVTDQSGDPMVGTRVSVVRIDETGKKRTTVAYADTDDRGEYRIGSLGSELMLLSTVSLSGVQADRNGFRANVTPWYFPGTESVEDATKLTLKPGEERAGMDFVLSLSVNLGTEVLDVSRSVQTMRIEDGAGRGVLSFGNARGFGDGTTAATNGAGVVRGRVLTAEGRAIARADVRLVRADMPGGSTARSAADGTFEFTGLLAGRYRATAAKGGFYQTLGNGPQTIPPFELGEGEKREGVDVRLLRLGVVEGRVVDERGDPIQGALVQLLNIRYEDGRRTLVDTNVPAQSTDDRGRFRLFNVRPGQFIVSAVVGDVSTAELPGYARVYYPGTADASIAQYVDVRPASEIAGIELPFTRIRTPRISGTLVDREGRPTMGGTVKLVPSLSSVVGISVGARIEPDGKFEFVNVSPGQYVIQVSRGRANSWEEGDFVAFPVSVADADITGLTLQAEAPSSVTGRVVIDTLEAGKAPQRGGIDIVPMPVDPLLAPSNNLATANIRSDWTFEMKGVTGVRRLLVPRLPRGWAVEAVRINGIDVTDRAFQFGGDSRSLRDVEVAVTDRVSTLRGTVAGSGSTPVPPVAAVVVFSVDRANWYASSRFLKRAPSDASGTFTVQGLPSGTYHAAAVAALPDDGADAWQDPAYLESLRTRASTVSVSEGQTSSVRLVVR